MKKNEIFRKGYGIIHNFIAKELINSSMDRILKIEENINFLAKPIESYSKPIVSLFNVGFPSKQKIIYLDQFIEINEIIESAVTHIKKIFNPSLIYAYEITIFKKELDAPALSIHQDSWYHPFKLSPVKFEYFSYYIPLTDFSEDTSLLGLATFNQFDINKIYRPLHIINNDDLHLNDNRDILSLADKELDYPKLGAGDCVIFEIRTPHNSKPHLSSKSRYALSIRFSIADIIINDLEKSKGNFVNQFRKHGKKIFLGPL